MCISHVISNFVDYFVRLGGMRRIFSQINPVQIEPCLIISSKLSKEKITMDKILTPRQVCLLSGVINLAL